jgi:hypothetical protein
MFGNRRCSWILALSLLMLLAAPARRASAAPILDVQVTDLSGGMFQYDYTLTNPVASDELIYDFGLFFTGDPLNVIGPSGWDIIAGSGFINWLSMEPFVTDILPGSSLGGFSFRSTYGPGNIEFEATTGDLATGFPVNLPTRAVTTGPAPAVPEPSAILMLATGAAGAWQLRRRRQENG